MYTLASFPVHEGVCGLGTRLCTHVLQDYNKEHSPFSGLLLLSFSTFLEQYSELYKKENNVIK